MLTVYPLAFVSEHSETLIELDVEYAELAEHAGIESYLRVPTVGTHADFIGSLASLVRLTLARTPQVSDADGQRFCPHTFKRCPSESS